MIVVVLFMSCVRLREMCLVCVEIRGWRENIREGGRKDTKHTIIYIRILKGSYTLFLGVVVHHPFENSTNILPGFSVDKGYLLLFFLFFM